MWRRRVQPRAFLREESRVSGQPGCEGVSAPALGRAAEAGARERVQTQALRWRGHRWYQAWNSLFLKGRCSWMGQGWGRQC